MNTRSKIDDGGPAFPSPAMPNATDERQEQRDGMTLRDWFAGQALAGGCGYGTQSVSDTNLVESAYSIADAMIRARQLPPT